MPGAVSSVDMLPIQIDARLVGYYMASLHSSGRHYLDLQHSPDTLYLRGASAYFCLNNSDAVVDLSAALTANVTSGCPPAPRIAEKLLAKSFDREIASLSSLVAGHSLPTVEIPKDLAPLLVLISKTIQIAKVLTHMNVGGVTHMNESCHTYE